MFARGFQSFLKLQPSFDCRLSNVILFLVGAGPTNVSDQHFLAFVCLPGKSGGQKRYLNRELCL